MVITFHSLEDSIVKDFYRSGENPCICPPRLGCVCGLQPTLRVITAKGITPMPAEVESNPRARSARLRAAERVLPVKENA